MEMEQVLEKQKFNEATKNLWSRYYGRKISTQEADEIRKNMSKLFDILQDINSRGRPT